MKTLILLFLSLSLGLTACNSKKTTPKPTKLTTMCNSGVEAYLTCIEAETQKHSCQSIDTDTQLVEKIKLTCNGVFFLQLGKLQKASGGEINSKELNTECAKVQAEKFPEVLKRMQKRCDSNPQQKPVQPVSTTPPKPQTTQPSAPATQPPTKPPVQPKQPFYPHPSH